MEKLVETLTGQLVIHGPKVIIGAAVFVVFWVLSRLGGRLVVKVGERAGVEAHVVGLLRQVARISLLVLGVVSALGTAGVNVSALVASLGLVGFALGFALKDAASNLLSGVMILVYSPFKVGDTVEVAGFKGVVKTIDLRYTTLDEKLDGGGSRSVLIPNSTLNTKPVSVFRKDGG